MGGATISPESYCFDTLCLQVPLRSMHIFVLGASAASSLYLWLRHPHHLFSGQIRFLLMFVSWGVDLQLWLNCRTCGSMDGYPVEVAGRLKQFTVT